MLPDVFDKEDTALLTDKEVLFLEALFGEAKGDPNTAKKMAGYDSRKPTSAIVKRLRTQILKGTQLYLAMHAPAAVASLIEIVTSNEPVIDARNKIQAAKEILDRAGVVKREQKTVTHNIGGVALLPPKVYNNYELLEEDEE